MKWSELTPEQRNTLIAEKVMGRDLLCTGRLLYAHTTDQKQLVFNCNECRGFLVWGSHFPDQEEMPEAHRKPILKYSESLDAAWLVVEKMKEATWSAFCIELDGVLTHHKWDRSQGKPYVTWFEQFLWSLNAEGICLAALRVCKVELDHDD